MKKQLFTYLFVLFNFSFLAQGKYNLKQGYAAEGYDVVSYFKGHPKEGSKRYVYKYDGVNFKFSSESNMNLFKQTPKKYVPQYGGWCAYAVAETSEKVSINPKTYEIRNGKLYLFYNSFGINTLHKWEENGGDASVKKADANWIKMQKK